MKLDGQSYDLKESVIRYCCFCLRNEISWSFSNSATFTVSSALLHFGKDSTTEEFQKLDDLDHSLVVIFPYLLRLPHSSHRFLLHQGVFE